MNIEEKEKYVIDKIKQKYDITDPEIAKMLLFKCEGVFKTDVGNEFLNDLEIILKNPNKNVKNNDFSKEYKMLSILFYFLFIVCFVSGIYQVNNKDYDLAIELRNSARSIYLESRLAEYELLSDVEGYLLLGGMYNSITNDAKDIIDDKSLDILVFKIKAALLLISGVIFLILGIVVNIKLKNINTGNKSTDFIN